MKTIILNHGKTTHVDDEDFPFLNEYTWRIQTGATKTIYAATAITVNGRQKTALMHRMILNAPLDKHVDHIDGDPLNNQKSNLRLCTRSQNLCNQKVHRNSNSGIRGVGRHNGKWRARIQVNGQSLSLGYFESSELAALAYRSAAIELHGEFARPSL